MALTKDDKETLLEVFHTLFDIPYCELNQHLGDLTLIEAFKVYCKIKKELRRDREN